MTVKSYLENRTYDELNVGDQCVVKKQITQKDIYLFAELSGDVNPVHFDETYAENTPFKKPICHGMLTGALISAVLATELPGPGTVYTGQSLQFRRPVYVGEEVSIILEVKEKKSKRNIVHISCNILNEQGKSVVTGVAEVMAPSEKVTIERPTLPNIKVDDIS